MVSENEVSYIIPVLDYSPASPFNILTLLDDLQEIPGEVIVIFNNPAIADELKSHPRINISTSISCNVGVSRAWNIGLNLCRTKYSFILNSDLRLGHSTVDDLLRFIKSVPDAAAVGPQGGFNNFYACADYFYFDKGMFNVPIEIDSVSGFLFLVNVDLFRDNGLAFDNALTPCYVEEWDMGLQIKRVNLKSYAVPCSDYEHHWGGSIKAYKKIKFYDAEELTELITQRNLKYFQSKWVNLAEHLPPNFLESKWKNFCLGGIDGSIKAGMIEQANSFCDLLVKSFPVDANIYLEMGNIFGANQYRDEANVFYRQGLQLDPKNSLLANKFIA